MRREAVKLMDKHIVALSLLVAFVLTLAAYVLLRLDGIEGGPLDEGLLILIGAIAGATVPAARRA